MAYVGQSRNVIRHVVSRGTAYHKYENAIHHPLLFACQGVRYRKLEVILTTVRFNDSERHDFYRLILKFPSHFVGLN